MRHVYALIVLILGFAGPITAAEIIAADNASDPAYNGGFADGNNGGFGFEPWDIAGAGSFVGGFVDSSTQNGRESINSAGNRAFALYANPSIALGAALREFVGGALLPGRTLSFDINFSWNGGDRGFSLYDADSNEILNLNHGGSDNLFIGGVEAFSNVFNKAVHVSVTVLSTSQVVVHATGASLTPFVSTNAIAGLPTRLRFYYFNSAGDGANEANYEPYFNNLEISDNTYHYVNPANPSPAAPYKTWATAATNIQDAIDASIAGDTVLVTNGIYQVGGRSAPGSSLTNRVLIDKPIRVQSVNGPDVTVIRGQGPTGDDAVRCVWLADGATLSGFTVTNGATRTSGDVGTEQSGGGLWCQSAAAAVSNCSIVGNTAEYSGGGTSGGQLDRCELVSNSAVYGGGAGFAVTDGTLNNCTLIANSAFFGGGAFGGTLNNCTVSGNNAHNHGGGVYFGSLNNCIVYFNTAALLAPNHTNAVLSYCCSTPDPGAGNITNDPQFVNGPAGDVRLLATSPCVDAGANYLVVGATDVNGNPRIFHGTVDMGAHETPATEAVTSSGGLVIPDQSNAGPYPSIITVGGVSGPVVGLRVRLNGLTHSAPTDLDIYLVSPFGQACVLMSDAGVDLDVGGAIITFDDFADAPVPQGAQITNGTYRPVNYDMFFADSLPPGVFAPVGSNLNALLANEVNGDWKLYVTDDSAFDSGSIDSWSLEFTWYFDSPTHYAGVANPTPAWPFASSGTAATTMQDAIDAATAGDTVYVADGIYEIGGRVAPGELLTNRVVIDKPILVHSLYGPEFTTIRGRGPLGPSAVRSVWVGNGATLAGFTVTNGHTLLVGFAHTELNGGGIWCESETAVVSRCRIVGNKSYGNGGGVQGGTLDNCLLAYNEGFLGGGANFFGSPGSLNNCTVTGNRAFQAGASYFGTLNNSILYFNTASSADPNTAGATLSYSCTTPDPGGIGNITGDPQFLNAAAGDFHLKPSSPCLNAGDNLSTVGLYTLDGYSRIIAGTVDMGAFEYNGYVLDSDGDGFTEYQEYVADTDPQNDTSHFPPLTLYSSTTSTVSWLVSSTSTARVYALMTTTNLLPPQVWSLYQEIPGSGTGALFTVPFDVPHRFFRSRVRLP